MENKKQQPIPQMPSQNEEELQISFKEIVGILVTRKWLILSIILVAFVLGIVQYVQSVPVYSASTTVTVSSKEQNPLSQEFLTGMPDVWGRGRHLSNEMLLLDSRMIAENTVRSLIASGYRNSFSLFGARSPKSIIEQKTGIDLRLNLNFLSSALHAVGRMLQPPSPEEAFDLFGEEEGFDPEINGFAQSLQGMISVAAVDEETDFLRISVTSPFPDEAAKIANAVAEAYRRYDVSEETKDAQYAASYIDDQMGRLREKMQGAEAELSDFMKNEEFYELSGNAENLLELLIAAESKYLDVEAELNIIRQRKAYFADKLTADEKVFSKEIGRKVLAQAKTLQNEVIAGEKKLIAMTREYGPEDPRVIAAQRELRETKNRLDAASNQKIAAELAFASESQQMRFDLISQQLLLDMQYTELKSIADEYLRLKNYYDSKLKALPKKQLQYAQLERGQAVLSKNYNYLLEKSEEAKMRMASESGRVRIIDPALRPAFPIQPVFSSIVLKYLLGGVFLAVVIVVGLELIDPSLKNEQFFYDHGMPVLATIPFVGKKVPGFLKFYQNGKGKEKERTTISILDNLFSPLAESIRELRTNISFSIISDDSQPSLGRTILVTGAEPGDGKSTISSNLALAYALSGKKTLLIDCDLRKPRQHKIFELKRSPGMSDYLSGKVSDASTLLQMSKKHENLWLLSAGGKMPNPNEMIGSKKMSDLVHSLQEEWEYIVIDTSPLALVSDAAVLSSAAKNGGIILAAMLGQTNKMALRKVLGMHNLREDILGVAVIADSDVGGYSRYSYYNRSYADYFSQ